MMEETQLFQKKVCLPQSNPPDTQNAVVKTLQDKFHQRVKIVPFMSESDERSMIFPLKNGFRQKALLHT